MTTGSRAAVPACSFAAVADPKVAQRRIAVREAAGSAGRFKAHGAAGNHLVGRVMSGPIDLALPILVGLIRGGNPMGARQPNPVKEAGLAIAVRPSAPADRMVPLGKLPPWRAPVARGSLRKAIAWTGPIRHSAPPRGKRAARPTTGNVLAVLVLGPRVDGPGAVHRFPDHLATLRAEAFRAFDAAGQPALRLEFGPAQGDVCQRGDGPAAMNRA